MSAAVFVTVTIPKDKEAEFLAVMDEDVKGSRAEEGCLRFDLLKGAHAPMPRFFTLHSTQATVHTSKARAAHGHARLTRMLVHLATGSDEGVYHFYEVYKSADAMAFHKTTPHYKKWADFKAANADTVGASQVRPRPRTMTRRSPCASLRCTLPTHSRLPRASPRKVEGGVSRISRAQDVVRMHLRRPSSRAAASTSASTRRREARRLLRCVRDSERSELQ